MSANIVSINNSCNCLASDVVKRLNLKFQKDKINRLHEQQTLELLKKKQKYQLLQSERQFKLHLIANGYIGDPFKYVDLEKKLEKKLFLLIFRMIWIKLMMNLYLLYIHILIK